jgi:hypothetical protein
MLCRTILFASLMAVAISATASAQKTKTACSRSCSEVVQGCVGMGGKGCDADLANCMKTGSLHMPSGKTMHNLCKK